jgi:molecular chaperone GrpE
MDETKDIAAAEEAFSAAAPPDPEAPGTGETSFSDAEAPPASERPPKREDEAAKYLELAKRKQAEFENYRKRMARENAQAAERGAARLAKGLLPAIDHLELSLTGAEGHADADVIKGFALVRDELIAALERAGIQRFSPEGEAFDPNEHEAMAQQPSEEAESGTVLQVYQQGYRINGQILRPARVIVAQ